MAHYEGRTFLRAFVTPLFLSIFTAVSLTVLLPRTVRTQLIGIGAPSATISTKANSGAKPSAQHGGNTELPGSVSTASCRPAEYSPPASIAMAAMPNGVTVVTDSPRHYVVGGATTAEILGQMRACAPGGEYAGQSGYNISWYYGYAIEPTGRCVVVDAKVGLHLNMILPQWQPGGGATSSVDSEWNRFSAALQNHEQGHQAISKTHANTMLNMLEAMSANSCSALKRTVQSQMSKMLASLQLAQTAYDAKTSHGLTQGAELQ